MKNGERPYQMAKETPGVPFRSAIFCRMEGALVAAEPIVAAAWCAANSQRLRQRATRLARLGAGVLLDVPAFIGGRPTSATRAWASLRGVSEDRLIVLGAEYGRRFLLPAISEARRALVTNERGPGSRLVLVSDYVDAVLAPVAELLQADLLWCNRLEFDCGSATGNMRAPILSGVVGEQAVRDFATAHRIDLKISIAYGAAVTDGALLNAVGQAYPMKPERKSRKFASLWPRPMVQA
jgi:phosphoserine phosphatase